MYRLTVWLCARGSVPHVAFRWDVLSFRRLFHWRPNCKQFLYFLKGETVMKGFFKPKLIFAIVTVLMLAVAAAVPLASSLGQSHAASATQNAAQSSSTNTPKCV